MPLRAFTIVVALCLGLVSPFASAGDALRLNSVFQLALENDSTWAAARYRYLATQEAYPIAR